MGHKWTRKVIFFCGLLFLSGCWMVSATVSNQYSDALIEKPEENNKETIETRHEKSTNSKEASYGSKTVYEENKQWDKRIYVTAEELQGNILGYTLIRMPPNPENMYFERDMPYLLEEGMVGKGIYISDYVCETEVFLGNILKEVIRGRGVVNGEYR